MTRPEMPKHTRQSPGTERPKPPKRPRKPQETVNKRLAEQTRKYLRKHYASKYRVR